MKDRVRKIINFRYDRLKDTELKLERLAKEGLLLEACGPFYWTFQKGDPKNLKYTITYFTEGSVYNPEITKNQQSYNDLAKTAGWDYVTQWNQLIIYCSEADHPIPFETDEYEKFNKIKRSMNKSFVLSMLLVILLLCINLGMHAHFFQQDPIEYLSDYRQLIPIVMYLDIIIYIMYTLIEYFTWCHRSKQAIKRGGKCAEGSVYVHRVLVTLFVISIIALIGWQLVLLALQVRWFIIFLCILQVPIEIFVFWSTIKYLRKKKASARLNKVLSTLVLFIINITYLVGVIWLIFQCNPIQKKNTEYRTITWNVGDSYSRDYKIYSDDILLTCEDLYGEIDYDNYSYEKEVEHTFLLKHSSFHQDSLPAKDSPPEITYEIYESKYRFVNHTVKKQLLKHKEWEVNERYQAIDPAIFDALEAYQKYFGDTKTGDYILIYPEKIITIDLLEPATQEQIDIIKDKLS